MKSTGGWPPRSKATWVPDKAGQPLLKYQVILGVDN
jgi:hypothetical protein